MVGIKSMERPKRTKVLAVNKVLKSVYQLYFRDKFTRRAVRQCLG